LADQIIDLHKKLFFVPFCPTRSQSKKKAYYCTCVTITNSNYFIKL
jgi:hypothetical protein